MAFNLGLFSTYSKYRYIFINSTVQMNYGRVISIWLKRKVSYHCCNFHFIDFISLNSILDRKFDRCISRDKRFVQSHQKLKMNYLLIRLMFRFMFNFSSSNFASLCLLNCLVFHCWCSSNLDTWKLWLNIVPCKIFDSDHPFFEIPVQNIVFHFHFAMLVLNRWMCKKVSA